MSPILQARPVLSPDLAHGLRTPLEVVPGRGALPTEGDTGEEERERLAPIPQAGGEIAETIGAWVGAPAGDRTRMPEGAGF